MVENINFTMLGNAVNSLKTVVTSMSAATTPEAGMQIMLEAHRSAAGTIELIAAAVEGLARGTAQAGSGKRSPGEYKCLANLKTLGSDKGEFKMWNEKLINALTQAMGVEWGDVHAISQSKVGHGQENSH